MYFPLISFLFPSQPATDVAHSQLPSSPSNAAPTYVTHPHVLPVTSSLLPLSPSPNLPLNPQPIRIPPSCAIPLTPHVTSRPDPPPALPAAYICLPPPVSPSSPHQSSPTFSPHDWILWSFRPFFSPLPFFRGGESATGSLRQQTARPESDKVHGFVGLVSSPAFALSGVPHGATCILISSHGDRGLWYTFWFFFVLF